MYIYIIYYNYIISGIIQYHCNDKPLDHAVQVIGYDFITGMYYNLIYHCTMNIMIIDTLDYFKMCIIV